MAIREKGKSPFRPGQPIPAELFVGRLPQIERILQRGVAQVAAGKPLAMFVQGEYGIGKSSIANYVQRVAERQHKLLRVYVNLGGAKDIKDLAERVLEALVRAGEDNVSTAERVKKWLGKFVGKQQLFGFTLNLEALKAEVPSLSTPGQMLAFMRETLTQMGDAATGMFIVFDELNGIVNNPHFAHFIKGFVEENAMATTPLPLLLMLCGVEERRRAMITCHPPIDRIFDIVEIEKMDRQEMREFFEGSFRQAGIVVAPGAMDILVKYSAGFPKIMHVVGDEAYYLDNDGVLDDAEAMEAVVNAAEEVGRKYVDQQVYKALRSPDYHSILKKIASHGPIGDSFTKKDVAQGLTAIEQKKLSDFLRRMKNLNVIRSGVAAGEYVFNVQMVRLYIWLWSFGPESHPVAPPPADSATPAKSKRRPKPVPQAEV